MKKLFLFILLSLGLTSISLAGYLDDWTDDQLCGWMDNPSPPEHIVAEINKRGLSCGVSNNASSSSTTTTNTSNTDTSVIGELAMDFELTSYDVEFSEKVTEELLSETLKTDFDFSKYKLVKNDRNLQCQFSIKRVSYEDSTEGVVQAQNLAVGSLVIDNGKVNINADKSWWTRGGISNDPTYLEDEVNLRLTEDGYLVGKMAFFLWNVDPGEPPVKPLYVELIKHKKSKPLDYKNQKSSRIMKCSMYDSCRIDENPGSLNYAWLNSFFLTGGQIVIDAEFWFDVFDSDDNDGVLLLAHCKNE